MGALHACVIVAFLALIYGEALYLRRRHGESACPLQDTVSNLSCGLTMQMVGLVGRTWTFPLFLWFFENARLLRLPMTFMGWAVALVTVDFCYYWLHRAGHRVNLVWAGHSVHHQSEEYNLSVALRQSSLLMFVSWIFYMPLVVLGVDPVMIAGASGIITAYQFWLHTELIGKLGPLEWVLNTPSHHRVHHGTNPQYLDRNYGGLLIIWDRMFGTFAEERTLPVYGTVRPLASWNPLWANFAVLASIAQLSVQAQRWRDRLLAWFAGPDWRPTELGGRIQPPQVSRQTQRKYHRQVPKLLEGYISANFVVLLFSGVATVALYPKLPEMWRSAAFALILVSTIALGGLLDERRWAYPLELARLALLGGISVLLSAANGHLPLGVLVAALAGANLVWLRACLSRPAQVTLG